MEEVALSHQTPVQEKKRSDLLETEGCVLTSMKA